MKKVISFEHEIDFPSMIGEISSISIDSSLKFVDESSIDGSLKVFGTYKMTEASTLEENFSYDLPVDIELTEKVDYKDAKISINDFNYEIKNDDILKCNIDILIDAVEEIILEEDNEVEETKEELPKIDNIEEEVKFEISEEESIMESLTRECDGDNKEMKDIDIEEVSENKEIKEDNTKNISSLFEVLNDAEETFTTYSVYILRKEDSIESVMEKYKVTKEELSNYNDLSNIEIGSKIVIPQSINE